MQKKQRRGQNYIDEREEGRVLWGEREQGGSDFCLEKDKSAVVVFLKGKKRAVIFVSATGTLVVLGEKGVITF